MLADAVADLGSLEGGCFAVWNTLKMQLFLLHPAGILNIDALSKAPFILPCALFHDRLFLQRFYRPRRA
jgi:hypothetical protein